MNKRSFSFRESFQRILLTIKLRLLDILTLDLEKIETLAETSLSLRLQKDGKVHGE